LSKVVGVGFQAHATLGQMIVAVLENGRVFQASAVCDRNPAYAWERDLEQQSDRTFGWYELPPVPGTEAHEQLEQQRFRAEANANGWLCAWCGNGYHKIHPSLTCCPDCDQERGSQPPELENEPEPVLVSRSDTIFDRE
jgi:hypothetical protein